MSDEVKPCQSWHALPIPTEAEFYATSNTDVMAPGCHFWASTAIAILRERDEARGELMLLRSNHPFGPLYNALRIVQAEREALQARVTILEDTLQTIAGFAPGNGDVCEIIAKRARAALAPHVEGQGGQG